MFLCCEHWSQCQSKSLKNIIRVILRKDLPEARANLIWRHGALSIFCSVFYEIPKFLVYLTEAPAVFSRFDGLAELILLFRQIELDSG